MKKCLNILTGLMLVLALCFSTASAQLMVVDGDAGTVSNIYSLPARNSSIEGHVAAGALVDAVDTTTDHSWFQVKVGSDRLWIPATALNAAKPFDLYWFETLDESIEMPATGAIDVYRSRLDPVATMTIETIPGKTAEETIAAIKERFPGGNDLSREMDDRIAVGYETVTERIEKISYAVNLNGGDVLLIEIIGNSDPEDDSVAFFNAALFGIHFLDTLSEIDRANRVFCPLCGTWFDTPETYAAHKCPGRAKTVYVRCPDCGNWYAEGTAYNNHKCYARSPEYVQCPDCGNWYEAGNVFRNHICPAKNYNYVQCPDCGEWFEEGIIFRNHVCPARNTDSTPEMVRCPDCGDWFEEGIIFRNHNCPAKVTNMVQCPDCGEWFEEGNIFRNHVCPAKSPAMVQCPDCGEWFEEGNVFRNHVCPARSKEPEQEQESTRDSIRCKWCNEWFDDEDVYIHHINYDCPKRDAYVSDSPAAEDPEPVEDVPQDPGAYDEPVDDSPQDPGAYDYPEPVDDGPQDPGAYDEPVDDGPQDPGAYDEPIDDGPQDPGAYDEPVDDGPQDPYAE